MPKFLLSGLGTAFLLVSPGFVLASFEADVIAETNEERIKESESTLTENALLSSIAAARAARMAETGIFSHTDADGHTAWYWLKESGYVFSAAGENIAVNFDDAESAVAKWMNSEGHRANILNTHFEEIGVGVAEGIYKGATSTYIVQLFGTRVGEQKIKNPEGQRVVYETGNEQKESVQAAAAITSQKTVELKEQPTPRVAEKMPKPTPIQEKEPVQELKQQEPTPYVAAAQIPTEEQPGVFTRMFRGVISIITFFATFL